MLSIYFRSNEKSERKPMTAIPRAVTSHPKWLEKLSDSSGAKDAESKSLESGEMAGYKVRDLLQFFIQYK